MSSVLIIDDDQLVRVGLRELLEYFDYSVLEAGTGWDGVAIFNDRADQIAVVIIDLRMDKMDGKATYQEIIKIRPDTPVLLTSGYRENVADLIALRDPTRTAFLTKPFDPPLLIARIEKFVEQSLLAGD